MDEFCETKWGLKQKVTKLAKFVRNSKHAVVYTGAGISTAAGIPDFRGPAGVWTLRAKGLDVPEPQLDKASPTYTHFALRTLLDEGLIHHVVSQNIDGLHINSGISVGNLTELHGNYCLEICQSCRASYYRHFPVWSGLTLADSTSDRGSDVSVTSKRAKRLPKRHDHRTGRKCESLGCKGDLVDTVVLFNEDIEVEAFETASNQTNFADIALVLGSSLRVKPACEFPAEILARGGKLVIVNLQRTPFDSRASLVIHASCDDVMRMLMTELKLETSGVGVARGSDSGSQPDLNVESSENFVGQLEDSDSLVSGAYDMARLEFEKSFMVLVEESDRQVEDHGVSSVLNALQDVCPCKQLQER